MKLTIQTAFFVAVGAAGLVLTFHPIIFSGFTRMQSDAGDVVLNHYFLEHTYRWAFDSHYAPSFWSPAFFYPTPNTFTYSETLIGAAPLYWLFRLGCSELLSCQLWILSVYALNFMSMLIVLRWFGVHNILAAAGAFVFAFGLNRTDHLPHQQLMPQFFSPFIVWYVVSFVREPSARRWFAIIALGTAQLFSSLHLGWFLVLGLMIFVPWLVIVEPGRWSQLRAFVRQRPIATVLPVVLPGLLIAPYARHFYAGNPERRGYGEAVAYLPYPDSWIVAAPGSAWSDHLSPRPADSFAETALFEGFAIYFVYGVAGWFAYQRRFPERGLVLASVGTAIVLGLLVTQFGAGISLWAIVHAVVPGANAFRAVGRIVFVLHLIGVIGGLIGFQAFVNERVRCGRKRFAIFAAVACIMMAEQGRVGLESFDPREHCYGPSTQAAEHLRGADAAHFVFDGTMPDYRHHITAMWAGLRANCPVMNGFSGTQPPGYPAYEERPSVAELVRLLGPAWHGKLVLIEWGPPVRRKVYQVEADGRVSLIESS